jgi:hypothetical protein
VAVALHTTSVQIGAGTVCSWLLLGGSKSSNLCSDLVFEAGVFMGCSELLFSNGAAMTSWVVVGFPNSDFGV